MALALLVEWSSGGISFFVIPFPLLAGVFAWWCLYFSFWRRLVFAVVMGILLDTFSLLPFGTTSTILVAMSVLVELYYFFFSDTATRSRRMAAASILFIIVIACVPVAGSFFSSLRGEHETYDAAIPF